MVELVARENMKPIYRILFAVLCLLPVGAGAAPVATTAGSNLTAYNPSSMGSINNNQWNSMLNSRTGSDSAPTADFGNCNALIMRCASPKCAGCTTLEIARPIVSGCVNSNVTCSQYGNDLIEYISAQLVSNATAKAESAAANAAAQSQAQNNEQLRQMQQQMQQMQSAMQAQSAEQAQLQAALEEQKQMTAAAQQQAAEAQTAQSTQAETGLTAAQQEAAALGVDPNLILREQIAGQIMSKVENADTALKALKATMKNAFDYAGCTSSGDRCEGPKRVKIFKQKAMDFFEPYNNVLDEMYDALITAQAVGVDIADVYMMLNGSCNMWGEYLCSEGFLGVYTTTTTRYYTTAGARAADDGNGVNITIDTNCGTDGKAKATKYTRAGTPCTDGAPIGPEDSPLCRLNRVLYGEEEVQSSWLDPEAGSGGFSVRVGCASHVLDNSALFRNRKKQTSIDIDVLERIVEQDSPTVKPSGSNIELFDYCKLWSDNQSALEQAVNLKKLPTFKVCISGISADKTDDSSGNTGCGTDGNVYIAPELALCSTHVYNIGEAANPTTESKRDEMRKAITLKTTFITQQMNKQYEYLEAMMRRFKTQLEKATLKSRLDVASESAAGGSGGGSNSGNGADTGWKSEVKNCNATASSDQDLLDCFSSNLSVFRSEFSANGPSTALKNEMKSNYESLKGLRFVSGTPLATDACKEGECSNNMRMNKSDFEACLTSMTQCLRAQQRDYRSYEASLSRGRN